ncbi:MAG: uroporphyrinogen-III synthase [Cellvibrionaceae bacterium]
MAETKHKGMSKPNLSGLHILVTRPEAQALPWAAQLNALGARTVVQPMLAIEALTQDKDNQAIKNRLLNLDKYQKAIFVSQNAVEYGVEWIDEFWPQLPTRLAFFAVGETTAHLLSAKLEYLGASVCAAKHAMNSEALLELNELQDVKGDNILIFRGQGGRTHLGKSLEARSALVDYCELYARVLPKQIDTHKINTLCTSTLSTVVAVHSGETLHNLCEAVETTQLEWIKQQALLIPGDRVANIAKTLGFNTLIIAENATHESMIGALNDWRQKQNTK